VIASPGEKSPEDRSRVILTPDQRVRVFISSTLEELAEERAAAPRAIRRLHLMPVWFESGARPHPPQSMYRAYLEQSQIFVGIYWQRYGWVGPGMEISGLEDEFRLAAEAERRALTDLSPPLLCAVALVVAAAGGLLPFTPIEPMLIGIAAVTRPPLLIVVIVVATVGQMASKWVLYAGSCRAADALRPDRRVAVDKAMARLSGTRRRPSGNRTTRSAGRLVYSCAVPVGRSWPARYSQTRSPSAKPLTPSLTASITPAPPWLG